MWPRLIALPLLLIFWAAWLAHLDRFPIPGHDELVIFTPGYKFVTEGVFGLDMLAGFYGMDTHFVQFMPIFPVLQGIAAQGIGIGMFQVRALPVMISAVTLCLAYALASRLFGRQAGVWTVVLLVVWQWSQGGDRWMGTGNRFFDFGRNARYDMLTALWGLLALWHFIQARETDKTWRYFLSGVFIGLAGLSHIYGFFFGPALLTILAIEKIRDRRTPVFRDGLAIAVGILLTSLPWFVQVARYWEDFVGQQTIVAERFNLLDWRFYWINLRFESQRYIFPQSFPAAYALAGTWLLLVGAPSALLRLAYLGLWKRLGPPLWLATTYLVIAALFAVLLPKDTTYVPLLVTLLAIAVGSWIAWLFGSSWRWLRYATACFVAIVVVQGAWSLAALHLWQAPGLRRTDAYMAEIRALIPPSSTVLGIARYWLAVPEPGFRSILLPIALSDYERNPNPISFNEAMESIAPDYIIMDRDIIPRLELGRAAFLRKRGQELQEYLDRHRATVVGVVADAQGEPIEVYRLEQN